ncbi:hypothetical protein [Streptomyces sp. NPDC092952]|uniref:hypothetical protein n=1 Tax=Streptomyces sp. NPDC092952 TaxID=3366018 RepID=UPI00381713D6
MSRKPLCTLAAAAAAAAAIAVAVLGGTGHAATAAPARATQAPDATSSTPPSAVNRVGSMLKFDSGRTSGGRLLPGGSYLVHCFTNGPAYTDRGRTSTVWLLMDFPSSPVEAKTWVSRVYLSPEDYDALLPHC